LDLSDLSAVGAEPPKPNLEMKNNGDAEEGMRGRNTRIPTPTGLHYNIQIHLPATKDVEVFNAILSPKIKQSAESRKTAAMHDSWLEGEKTDILGFVDFGDLVQVIVNNWEHFSVIPSQHWLNQRMDELEKVRNFIAHNRMLQPSEFQRVYMYIADWNRVVGL
jgi:hypothetical protein